jgi:hypothetical protein
MGRQALVGKRQMLGKATAYEKDPTRPLLVDASRVTSGKSHALAKLPKRFIRGVPVQRTVSYPLDNRRLQQSRPRFLTEDLNRPEVFVRANSHVMRFQSTYYSCQYYRLILG